MGKPHRGVEEELREFGLDARMWLRSVGGELAVEDMYRKMPLPLAD